MVDFTGHLAAVFFVSGCNFRCGFCHNAELMARQAPCMSWNRLRAACERFVRNWVDAAVITGGEPTSASALPDLVRFLKAFGWAVKLDTNGSNPDILAECLPLVDYVAMDIKTGPSRYPWLTGFTDIERLQGSMALIREQAPDYEFRTTIIESCHTDALMQEIGDMIKGARRYVLQPFVPKQGLPDPAFETLTRTTPARLDEIQQLMRPYAREVIVHGD